MMPLEEEFALLLDALGLGTYRVGPGGTIFWPAAPSTPDVCTTLALYGGTESSSTGAYDEPRLQVRCRGAANDPRTPRLRAQAVYDALHGLGHRPLAGGSQLQLAIGITSGPEYLGRDGTGRHEYVINFRTDVLRDVVRPT